MSAKGIFLGIAVILIVSTLIVIIQQIICKKNHHEKWLSHWGVKLEKSDMNPLNHNENILKRSEYLQYIMSCMSQIEYNQTRSE